MLKILTIVGARPQIIKAAALSRAIKNHFSDKINEIILHTGQHYDDNMSQVFFDELGIPEPDYNLSIGSSSHGKQTAAMLSGIEEVLLKEKPDCLVVYGDTNSTLAGAIAAAKIHVPVVHIEAGLRSFNKYMPEEVNRIACDHVSTLLFSPTKTGYDNLVREGFKEKHDTDKVDIDHPLIFHCGDVMYDNSLYFSKLAEENSKVLMDNGLEKGNYALVTIHRNNNTDEPNRLEGILSALDKISKSNNLQMILPLHPRTAKIIANSPDNEVYKSVKNNELIRVTQPASFLDMILLEKHSKIVLTDSGGVQKEAYFFQKPCLIFRPETEWREIIEIGTGILTDADKDMIINSYNELTNKDNLVFPDIFGDGKASEFICRMMLEHIGVSKQIAV